MLKLLNELLWFFLFMRYYMRICFRYHWGRLYIYRDTPYWFVKAMCEDFEERSEMPEPMRRQHELARQELALRDAKLKKERANAR